MLKGKILEDDFYKKYRGQRYRGIATPADYPYIYLIYSEGKYEYDNIDVDGDGTHNRVYFSSEGEGAERFGNKAIIEHEKRKGVYNSLLLFRLDAGEIEYIGEYYLERVHREEQSGRILYFELVKEIIDIDATIVYYVGEKKGEENSIFPIGDREEYFDNKISELEEQSHVFQEEQQEEIEGTYVDVNFSAIQELDSVGRGARPEEKKVAQHKKILDLYNRRLRRQMKRYAREREARTIDSDEGELNNFECILYCVNVGCALTTFLVVNEENETQKELWCFDWGIDKNKDVKYIQNIELCLEHIHNVHFLNRDLHVNKFFLSHPDLDHFGQAKVDYFQDSEIWINPYIHSASTSYINFVKELLKRTRKFVEPISANSVGSIIIHHPDRTIEFRFKGVRTSSHYYTSKSNNVSPILEVQIGEKSIILPGDIEHQGWNWYKTTGGTAFDEVSVSVHSHHGSKTGFITNIPNVCDTEYETICSEIDFLSSRDGAYPGIVSNEIKHHASYGNTKITDENGLVFYEVNLSSMQLRKKMDDGSWIDL